MRTGLKTLKREGNLSSTSQRQVLSFLKLTLLQRLARHPHILFYNVFNVPLLFCVTAILIHIASRDIRILF
uniref:Uncharacterized protein n=1 Tax=Anguilla anguilla TaxID=7936 RepID=A0A0E9UPD1_ANGAN